MFCGGGEKLSKTKLPLDKTNLPTRGRWTCVITCHLRRRTVHTLIDFNLLQPLLEKNPKDLPDSSKAPEKSAAGLTFEEALSL